MIPMPDPTPAEAELSEAMRLARLARMVAQDEAFKEALLIAHPDIYVGVHTAPCTDNPQPIAPVVIVRSCQGFDWPKGD